MRKAQELQDGTVCIFKGFQNASPSAVPACGIRFYFRLLVVREVGERNGSLGAGFLGEPGPTGRFAKGGHERGQGARQAGCKGATCTAQDSDTVRRAMRLGCDV